MKREVLANQQWATVQAEERENQQLLELSRQILDLTKAVHQITVDRAGEPPRATSEARRAR
jgi:hypothetical protein